MTTQQELCENKLLKVKGDRRTSKGVTAECGELLKDNVTFSKSLFSGTTATKNKAKFDLDDYVKKEVTKRTEREMTDARNSNLIKEQEKAQAALVESQQQQQEYAMKKSEREALGSFRPAQNHRTSGKDVWEKCETYKGKNCVSKDDLVGTCGYYQRQYINPENGRTEITPLDQPKRLKIPGSTQAFDYPVTLSQCGARKGAKTTTNEEIDMMVGGKKSRRKKRKVRKTKKYNIKK